MGRAFEFRKERKFKRWGHMARVFTKIGKEITIAVKQGGPDVTGNPRLRALIQTARSENMPKDNIERAIKRATDKDQADYKEVVFEGYGPHGIAVLVEAATDNNNRTVANVRSYFTKSGGSLGTSGSVDYMFDRKCMFRMKSANPYDLEELELELIDYGVEEIFEEENENEEMEIVLYGEFTASTLSRSGSRTMVMSLSQLSSPAFLTSTSRFSRAMQRQTSRSSSSVSKRMTTFRTFTLQCSRNDIRDIQNEPMTLHSHRFFLSKNSKGQKKYYICGQ